MPPLAEVENGIDEAQEKPKGTAESLEQLPAQNLG